MWLGLAALASWIGVIAISSTMHATFGRARVDSPIYYALGIWIVVTLLMSIFGLILGIAGVCSPKGGSRNTALIGLLLNLALPIGIMLFTVLAMLADPSPQPILKPNDPDGPTRRSLAIGGIVLLACVVGIVALLRKIVNKGEPSLAMAFAPAVLARLQQPSTKTIGSRIEPSPATTIPCTSCPQKLPPDARFCRRCGHRVDAPRA